jgi:ABC-2 type transport system permease protein
VVFCGVNFPISYIPTYLQPISYGLPLTYGVISLRDAMAGASVLDLLPNMIIIAFIGALMLMIAYALFWIFEIIARKKGTLDIF